MPVETCLHVDSFWCCHKRSVLIFCIEIRETSILCANPEPDIILMVVNRRTGHPLPEQNLKPKWKTVTIEALRLLGNICHPKLVQLWFINKRHLDWLHKVEGSWVALGIHFYDMQAREILGKHTGCVSVPIGWFWPCTPSACTCQNHVCYFEACKNHWGLGGHLGRVHLPSCELMCWGEKSSGLEQRHPMLPLADRVYLTELPDRYELRFLSARHVYSSCGFIKRCWTQST